jgi:hypothetical protein
MRRLLLALAVIVAPLSADAGYYQTGNDLLEACRNSIYGMCLGYAAGIADAAAFTPASNVCIPDAVILNQVRDVIVDYLNAHPEIRHEPAYFLATKALSMAWPCRSN